MSRFFPWHPILFAFAPIWYLYVNNQTEIAFVQVVKPLLVILLFTAGLILVMQKVFHGWHSGAVFTSFLLSLFFSFGYVERFWERWLPEMSWPHLSMLVLIIEILALVVGILLVVKLRLYTYLLSMHLNIMALGLLLLIGTGLHISKSTASFDQIHTSGTQIHFNSEGLPDIYYIILDGHPRADIVQSVLQHDNSEFIHQLNRLGFFVASKSVSNYSRTHLSLASTLNMKYLDYATSSETDSETIKEWVVSEVINNQVYRFLKQYEYQLITYASSWGTLDSLELTDYYLKPPLSLSELEMALVFNTPLTYFQSYQQMYTPHRKTIEYTLEHLDEIAKMKGPTFTYAHILAVHEPFVFTRDGSPLELGKRFESKKSYWSVNDQPELYKKLLLDQMDYIDQKVIAILESILVNSEQPPIIVLQSDHGTDTLLLSGSSNDEAYQERMSILNAYYFPGNAEVLYDSITPVNTFRLLFRSYFDLNVELVQDRSYYSPTESLLGIEDVTQRVL